MNTRTLLSETEVSETLNISRSLLRKWRMNRTHLPFIKLGSRAMYSIDDINTFVENKKIHPLGGV